MSKLNGRQQNLLKVFIDWFIPDFEKDVAQQTEQQRRGRILVAMSFGLGVVSLFTGLDSLNTLGYVNTNNSFLFLTGFILLINPVIMRKTRSYKLSGTIVLLAVSSLLLFLMLTTGGFLSPAIL